MKLPKRTEVIFMREKTVKMKFTDFECNLLINGIFEWRNMLLEQGLPTKDVNTLIIKIIDKSEGK